MEDEGRAPVDVYTWGASFHSTDECRKERVELESKDEDSEVRFIGGGDSGGGMFILLILVVYVQFSR